MNKLGLIGVVFALLAGCVSTGAPPKVGDLAPDFSLVGVTGNEVHLSDFKGKKVVLIFYSIFKTRLRGAGVNSCAEQLKEVQGEIDRFKKLNAEVIAISSMGDQRDVKWMKKSLGITFTLIPKPSRKVAEDFGVWNKSGNYATAIIIIDQKGRIRYKKIYEAGVAGPYYGYRLSTSEIITQLQGI